MTTTTELSQEEKRVKIAETCGFVKSPKFTVNGMPIYECNGKLFATRVAPIDKADFLPDYFNDLNAMHKAENVLTDEQRFRFACMMGEIVLATPDDLPNYELTDYGPGSWAGMKEVSRVISATAAQRAEAFGKTLNLW